MKHKKLILLYIGITIALLAIIARLLTFGFMYPLGLASIVIFAPIHTIFLYLFYKYSDQLNKYGKIIGLVGAFIFPLIYLFQFDIEEFVGSSYVYEIYTGEFKTNFDYYAYYISILAAVIYVVNFILWVLKLKKQISLNRKNLK
jgi:hypothetical protein